MLCIIQARLSSTRLKSKMLKKIYYKTVIQRVVFQILKSKNIKKIVIAISNHSSDDLLEQHVKNMNIEVFRGSLNNVAMRYYEVSKKFNHNAFIRINGDSPFIDYKLIDMLIEKFIKNNYDILTNSYTKTFPKGQGIEIIRSKIFQKEFKNIRSKKDQEHVFPFFYKKKNKYFFKNFSCKENLNHLNFSVDTFRDLVRLRKIAYKFKNKVPNLNELTKKNMKLY